MTDAREALVERWAEMLCFSPEHWPCAFPSEHRTTARAIVADLTTPETGALVLALLEES